MSEVIATHISNSTANSLAGYSDKIQHYQLREIKTNFQTVARPRRSLVGFGLGGM
jgi:hypothetical protein